MSETTPLLSDAAANELSPAKDVYDRFSNVQKRVILMIVSPAGLLAPFSSGSFIPCVPEIAKDLNTTGTIINYTVGAFIFTLAIGNLLCAPYAGFYGRRPVYLALLPIYCVGSLGASMSVNVFQLTVSRTLQGIGGSCMIPVGAAAVSDIYRLEHRGTAMGVFFGVVLLGPAVAPLIGGIFATYTSWRVMQLMLFSMGFIVFISIAAYLPETSHPGTRGIDKLPDTLGEISTLATGDNRRWKWAQLNPFMSAIELSRSPNILLMGPRYGLTTPALIGLCFLPAGAGNIVGAIVGGRLADRAVVRGLQKRGGEWIPEDRLTATLSGALLLVPLSVLIFGLTTQFVPGKIGLVINLICLFTNGVGIDIVLSPSATYCVDILRNRSAEVVAFNSAIRNVVCAFASAAVLPTINSIGVAATNGIAAGMTWIAFGLLLVAIRYGGRLRSWVDIGYTTTLMST